MNSERRVGFAHHLLRGVKKVVGKAHPTLLLTLLLCGCATSKGQVTLRGVEGRSVYAQSFSHAYITSGHDGEYDVILMQDSQVARPQSGNSPLQPMTGAELRQIVHIHVFWQADGGSVAKDGVVTNAAINWYMIAHEASERPEVLRYEGAGVVMLDEGRKSTSVEIRDGMMKKTQIRGSLKDPLGPSHLSGVVKAEQNTQLVRDLLADLKARNSSGSVALGGIR